MFNNKELCIIDSCSLLYFYKELLKKNIFSKIYYSYIQKNSTSIYENIINKDSIIYKKEFDIYIIGINDTLRQQLFNKVSSSINSPINYEEILNKNIECIIYSINEIKKLYNKSVIFISIYPFNAYNNKLFSYKYSENIISIYHKYCYLIYNIANKNNDVYILDTNIIKNVYDINTLKPPKSNYSGIFGEIYGSHLNPDISELLVDLFISKLNTIYNYNQIKAVIVDLDNTLWEGVYLESEKVKLNIFRVNCLYQLHLQGILLCICSKNNEDEITFNNIKNILGSISNHILIYKINWNPKSQNIKEIVNQLNISPKNVAFFDDQEFERSEVNTNYPDINVYDDKKLDYILLDGKFNSIHISDDSKNRKNQYELNIKRDKYENKNNFDKYIYYIKSLNFELSFLEYEPTYLDRVYELIKRTNKQNFTLKRYDICDIKNFVSDKNNSIFIYKLKDIFGNYGIICVILLIFKNSECIIDEFAMSCRAFGKKIEKSIFTHLNNTLFNKNIKKISTCIFETNDNSNIIKELNDFNFIKNNNNMSYNINGILSYPEWIKLK
jgi:FkbH-like protein